MILKLTHRDFNLSTWFNDYADEIMGAIKKDDKDSFGRIPIFRHLTNDRLSFTNCDADSVEKRFLEYGINYLEDDRIVNSITALYVPITAEKNPNAVGNHWISAIYLTAPGSRVFIDNPSSG